MYIQPADVVQTDEAVKGVGPMNDFIGAGFRPYISRCQTCGRMIRGAVKPGHTPISERCCGEQMTWVYKPRGMKF